MIEYTYEYFAKWIDDHYPEHGRTSCNDDNLNNSGSIMYRYRCERCESLEQLKYWKLQQEMKSEPPTEPHNHNPK